MSGVWGYPKERSIMNKKKRSSEVKKKMKIVPELVMEILSWLPVKSLFRFRCVSKEWLRLLTSNTHFINHMHHKRLLTSYSNNLNPSIISLHNYKIGSTSSCYIADYKVAEDEGSEGDVKPIYLDLPMDNNMNASHDYYFYTCVGICNGLVCLTLHQRISNRHKMVLKKLFVWNPLTREHITLSSCLPIPSPFQTLNCKTNLSYDEDVIFGFGFHQATNEYKVVRILISKRRRFSAIHVSVNTLGTKTWRSLGDVPYDFKDCNIPITINRSPHWLVARFGSKYKLIVTFDVKDEVFREIPLPLSIEKDPYNKIKELGGLLCIFINSILKEEFETWVMKEHGVATSWTMLFKIRQSEIPKQFSRWNPLDIGSNGVIILRSDRGHGKMELLLYNPETNSFKGPTEFPFYLHHVFSYAGSLVSPKFINGGVTKITLSEDFCMEKERR